MPITSINDGNGLNSAGGNAIRNSSKFINKVPIGGTYRFGEYGVNFCAETVADDKNILHLGHNIISNTLKAPLLQDVILKKDLFWVPDMAILPLNWEKFFVNPVKGEDVPNDVGCAVENFGDKVADMFGAIEARFEELQEDPTSDDIIEATTLTFRYLLASEMIFSDGCLLSALQCNLTGVLGKDFVYGEWFDSQLSSILAATDIQVFFPNQTDPYTLSKDKSASDNRTILTLMRDDFSFIAVPTSGDLSDVIIVPLSFVGDLDFPVNLRRLWAYQIACAHFYTNDKIDYVYTAELFRQLVFNCWNDLNNVTDVVPVLQFQVNGLTYQYDYLSAAYFDSFVNMILSSIGNSISESVPGFQYLRLLFGYNLSLRYLDYFTGSRSQPLAVGDVTVAVNNNMVNVVNIAAKTMAAKMLNVANRFGQRVESYVKEFFGIEMAKDYHNPFWLAHTSDQIDNPENQNTGAAQYDKTNSITSIFRTGGNSNGIEFHPDRSGVVIGICYFDIQRVYPRSISRHFFHVDRYDDFLPYLQYVGDQEVYQKELDSLLDFNAAPFGYQGRNMEYKQIVPYCFGGFAHDLAPYVFLANEQRPLRNNAGLTEAHIGPSYIRSLPTELDRFFNILNGYSIDTYYHFAIVNNIYWESTRPMAALPGILNG